MTDDRNLDKALAAWARHDAGDEAALARILDHADAVAHAPAQSARPSWRPWLVGGGAVAASIAVALLLTPTAPAPGIELAPTPEVQLAMATPDAEVESFALLHTLTSEEEAYL
jgi:hypothetical protein